MTAPIVKAEMLIRKPPAEVFNAFADPAVTTKFWFTKSSGKLEAGKRVRWEWEMYGVGDDADVKEIEPNKRIVFEWSFPKSNMVEMMFAPHAKGTLVTITNSGLRGADVIAEALDLTQGWNLVLAAAKAWLELRADLDIVADSGADHIVPSWEGRR
ncbi:SRPBCC family protein [Terricaulis silvestris]|uniref:Activator of Hsp90 ATPase n=1 Tax=Terricaulis silvestris TaxID=2686094 RepID=A0A6I6MXM8_9CAUL|nr:SRPBCC family protein [Terricaulis silvestris]QGZ96392.1 Activator of Hsp90 ATPase [Terricaulis silvestris]